MAAGENPGALVAGMHSHLADQAVADWQAALTAVRRLDHVGVGPVGYSGMSMGCGLGIPLIAAEPRIRAAHKTAVLGAPAGTPSGRRVRVGAVLAGSDTERSGVVVRSGCRRAATS
ncbi:hypothetical protein ACFY0A_37575 [Streptomyces sp. NPDC001698]|uniref:hypothetical protein n=1 Tax=Streptomyces sp. NPDC001698 TaxID=3364601 RepID=UPI0036921136